jgi:hypothetical protein
MMPERNIRNHCSGLNYCYLRMMFPDMETVMIIVTDAAAAAVLSNDMRRMTYGYHKCLKHHLKQPSDVDGLHLCLFETSRILFLL